MNSHWDYNVAWICALPVEAAAARALLDATHTGLPQSSEDDNSYTLGEISGHNIVITYLPSGSYGTISAATVAANMQSTFPALRFCLLVGIGGGVPSKKNDIRLGDIVVSRPTGTTGGVIQYDYGKTIAGGAFQQTGMMNQPPQVLLKAIARLQTGQILGHQPTISEIISEVQNNNKCIRAQCPRPDMQEDQLYNAAYEHLGDEDFCTNCDEEQKVQRSPRASNKPQIHYGIIASANQVMRHGQTRDQLAKSYGILCFEMEAAGIMNQLPALVIRGICDYSDSHKNNRWQGYAALTAAAYGKTLLSVVPKDNSLPRSCSMAPLGHSLQGMDVGGGRRGPQSYGYSSYVGSMAGDYVAGSNNTHTRNEMNRTGLIHQQDWITLRDNSEKTEELLRNISNYDHNRVHRRLAYKRLPGTTKWFLDHPVFKDWFEQKSATSLWCSGIIGSGKTIIATAVVDAAKRRALQQLAPTVFFYCESEQPGTLQATYILASFIKQLYELLCETSKLFPKDVLRDIKYFFGDGRTEPDFDDLAAIFSDLFYFVPDTVYILDGLDNLERHHSEWIKFRDTLT